MTEPSRVDPPGDSEPAPADDRSFYEEPVWKRFYAFLLGPALIAAAVTAIFTIYSVLSSDEEDPLALVAALQDGGEHRRWQAAFALTRYLQPSVSTQDAVLRRESDAEYRKKLERVQVLLPELLEVWDDPERGDPEVRRFLALAFGYLGDPRVLPALQGVLDSEDAELVHYALAAVATTVDVATRDGRRPPEVDGPLVEAVLAASRRREHDIRATSIYVLAVLGGDPALRRLREAVEDPAPSVAWNAAFGLARHGDRGGEKVLVEILDRGPLYEAAGPDGARQHDLFLNAVRSAGMVPTPALEERLERIARSDDNLAARNLAIEILKRPAEEG